MNELSQQLDATWRRFRAAVDRLAPAHMDRPIGTGWTVKEMVGHLGFWLEATEGVIVGMFRGQPLRADFAFGSGYQPDPAAPWPAADVHNAREAGWARSRTPGEVVARLDAGHLRFAALLDALEPGELADERYRSYVGDVCAELDAHLQELLAVVSEGA